MGLPLHSVTYLLAIDLLLKMAALVSIVEAVPEHTGRNKIDTKAKNAQEASKELRPFKDTEEQYLDFFKEAEEKAIESGRVLVITNISKIPNIIQLLLLAEANDFVRTYHLLPQ